MKILLVCEDIPRPQLGGLGKHVLALASELHSRGHEVDILGSAYHPIDTHPEQAGPGRFIGDISGHQRGWAQRHLGAFHPAANALNGRALARAIMRHAPGHDVIHYHGHLPWVAQLLPPQLPFTQSRHDQGGDCMLQTRFRPEGLRCEQCAPEACAGCATVEPNFAQRQLSHWSVRRVREATSRGYARYPVIFVSAFLQTAFAKVSAVGLQGEVIHNAAELQALRDASAAAGLRDGTAARVEVFAAGQLTSYKGFGQLLGELHKQGLPGDWRLTIAGDGPELGRLRERHASDSVQFLGWCDRASVLGHTVAADVVVVPSVWEEPCATTVIEALALGRTVFALRLGGTPELAMYAGPGGERLRLFDNMPELVHDLRGFRGAAQDAADSLVHFTGTVSAMTDAVLAHYARHFGVR